MRRTIVDYPVTPGGISDGSMDPGSSPYQNSNTPFINVAEAFANEDAVNYPVAPQGYFYCNPAFRASAQGFAKFPAAPTLARFISLTFETAWDYSQQGANNWLFPPANAFGPKLTITLKGRDGVTQHHGGYYEAPDPDVDNLNCNVNTENPNPHVQTWQLFSHPEGGPFTLQDLNEMAVGVTMAFSLVDNRAFVDGRFNKARCFYLKRTLEVEDLGGFVENQRHGSSLTLRLMRRARNAIKPDTLVDHSVGRVGSRVYLSHPRGGSATQWWQFWRRRERRPGWGRRRLERRVGQVLRRVYHPASLRVEDQTLDLRPIVCLGWAAYRIDGPWSPELQGLALLDKGRGFVHDRNQDSWASRPGDGVLMRVLEDYPNLSPEGLAVAGGGDDSIALRNYDLMQAGWSTVASAGDFGVTADATIAMAEEQGYLSSARLAYGAGGGAGGRERSLGTLPFASGDYLHVRVILKNTSVPTPGTQFGEVYLSRSGGGLPATEFWDNSTRTWGVAAAYIPVPSTEPYGELVMDAIPCDAPLAAADPTYVIGVGRFSANMGPVTLHGAIVDVQHTDSTVTGARPPLVVLDAPITRVADSHTMAHVWGRELWVHERGTAVVEVRLWSRAALLPNGTVKPLLHAQHAVDTWQALQFVAVTGSDDLVRFEAAISGEATFQLDCPITGIDLTRDHVLRAWARWLGADGWTEFGPYSVQVGYAVFLEADGSLVGTGSVIGRLASETAVPTARDYLGIGCDEMRQLDGWVGMWETRRNPLAELEAIWKV
jgi:hypothetical protein